MTTKRLTICRVIHSLKMYKIPNQAVQFIKKTIKVWIGELRAEGIRGIFHRDTLSPLLFVIAMMPLNHVLRKYTAGYKLSKSQEKITHLMYMDNIKLFCQKRKRIRKLNTNCENILSRYRNGIRHRKMHHVSNKKWQTTRDRRSRTTKSKSSECLEKKKTYKYLRILEGDTIKQS